MIITANLSHQGKITNTKITFSEGSHNVFHNFQHIILSLNLNAKGITLLSYICEKMKQDNVILINDEFKRAYIEFVNNIAQKSIDIRTVNNFIKKFQDKHLIIKRKDLPCLYIVNPKYFSKGSKNKRTKLLQLLLSAEYDGKIDKEALLNRPIESFFEEK